mmetsp:Transcript_9523/g.23919  ORF Transcript_9523/g.23919 Transcript_9523/m.23919 type:complete len:524 (+) Transcript_9523:264-1835(+)
MGVEELGQDIFRDGVCGLRRLHSSILQQLEGLARHTHGGERLREDLVRQLGHGDPHFLGRQSQPHASRCGERENGRGLRSTVEGRGRRGLRCGHHRRGFRNGGLDRRGFFRRVEEGRLGDADKLLLSDAAAEITKALAGVLGVPIQHKDGLENGLECTVFDLVVERPCEMGLVRAASGPDLIGIRTRADEAEFGHVRAGATVRATSHAHVDGDVDTDFLAERGDAVDDGGHDALGFRDGETAEWQGGAGHGEDTVAVVLAGKLDTVLGKNGFDGLDLVGGDVPENDVLIGGDDHVEFQGLAQEAEGGLEAHVPVVFDAAVLNKEAEELQAVALVVPAKPVLVLPLGELPPGFDLLAEVRFDEFAELIDAHAVDGVLEAGVCAVLAVAVIALGGDDRLHEVEELVRADEAQMIGCASKSGLLLVGATQTASDGDVEAFEHAGGAGDDDDADVLDVDIDGVVAGDCDSHLELSGQVNVAVNGLDVILENGSVAVLGAHDFLDGIHVDIVLPVFEGGCLLAVEPDL